MDRDFITIVSGLPRSGTSLMMQMLQAGGLPVLTDGVRAADENNLRGYLEFEPVKRLRSDRTWLPLAKGRAVKVIHLLLRELPFDGSLQFRVLLMQRPVPEVLASQRAMLKREGKAGGDPALLQRAFENQIEQLQAWLTTQTCVRVLPLQYHQVIEEPLNTATAVKDFLGFALDIAAMAKVADPALHRQRLAT